MATRRRLLRVFALAVLAPAAPLHASGWEYEAPPLLPYYLDRLPAKPLGQILAEHGPAAAPVCGEDRLRRPPARPRRRPAGARLAGH